MTDVRTAILNVPCTGEFKIATDGSMWEVMLHHKNGESYNRMYTDGDDRVGTFFNVYEENDTYTIEEWMWECVADKLNELTIGLERDSIVTPHVVSDYAQ